MGLDGGAVGEVSCVVDSCARLNSEEEADGQLVDKCAMPIEMWFRKNTDLPTHTLQA